MTTAFRNSFAKDLRSIKDPHIRDRVAQLIESIEQAVDLSAISNLKKLRGAKGHYRARLGEYRVGLTFEASVVTFVRCLHRKEMYRYFP